VNKLFLIPLIALLIVSGCTQQPQDTIVTTVEVPDELDAPKVIDSQDELDTVADMQENIFNFYVEVLNFPNSANSGEALGIEWKVNSDVETTINHTAVHYSYTSNPERLGLDVSPKDTIYSEMAGSFGEGNFEIPTNFAAELTPSLSGTIYFRAHAIIDGKNYWTEEKMIEVLPGEGQQTAGLSDQEIIESKGIDLDEGLDSSIEELDSVRKLE